MKYREAKPKEQKTKMILYLDENLRREAGKLIDGIRYLTLGHVINLALLEFVHRKKADRMLKQRKKPAPQAPPTGTL